MKNLYQILAIQPGADPDEIKRAYYALAKIYHPDSQEQADVQKFYEVTEAYQILSDAARRRAYDATLKTGRLEKGWMESDESVEVTYGRPNHEENLEFRMHELNRFRRRVFWRAVGKVILSFFVGGGAGNVLVLILGGSATIGPLAGALFGFVWSVNAYFDLESFIPNHRHFVLVQWAGRTVEVLSLLYFVGLFLYHLFR